MDFVEFGICWLYPFMRIGFAQVIQFNFDNLKLGAVPALMRLRQEDYGFEASLGYIVSSWPVKVYVYVLIRILLGIFKRVSTVKSFLRS